MHPSAWLSPCFRAAGVAFMVYLLTGCVSTPNSRILENPELFQSLDHFSQSLVRKGFVNYGFSADTVYLALGKPDRVAIAPTTNGPMETWAYRNFLYGTVSAAKLSVTSGAGGAGPGDAGNGLVRLTLNDSSDMPLATLVLGFFEDHVVTIRLEP